MSQYITLLVLSRSLTKQYNVTKEIKMQHDKAKLFVAEGIVIVLIQNKRALLKSDYM